MSERPVGEIKFTPKSFTVQELVRVGKRQTAIPLSTESIITGWDGQSAVTLFHLTKTGWATEQATRHIARQLRIPASAVSSYGLKDRHAHTSQCIGIEGDFHPEFQHDDMCLRQTGTAPRPLIPGGNAGNRFRIEVLSEARSIDEAAFAKVPNLFGSQRIRSRIDGDVGRLLLEGHFAGAAEIMPAEYAVFRRLRRVYERERDWKKAWFDAEMTFDFRFNMLKWQSWLWNQLLQDVMSGDCAPERLPMWCPENAETYRHLWDPACLDEDSLYRLHRFNRPTLVRPWNISAERMMLGWKICFDLPAGAYATVVLSQAFELVEAKHR